MRDLKDRLKDRTDLEKLEQVLAEIKCQVDLGMAGKKIQKLAREARRDLEDARASQAILVMGLFHSSPGERMAARQEVERLISAGETKLFDPATERWCVIGDVLDEARGYEEAMKQREAENQQIEAQLKDAANMPRYLHQLHHLILLGEEMLIREQLSPDGKAGLTKAREKYQSGCTLHSKLTNAILTGTLNERFVALDELKELTSEGEKWIFVAPANVWLPADQALASAQQSFEKESKRLCDEAIDRADKLAITNLHAALKDLYLALDNQIPYLFAHRSRLLAKYTTLLDAYRKQEKEFPEYLLTKVNETDKSGFIKIRGLYLARISAMIKQSHTWLNQFFHSTITQPVNILLSEAENDKTQLARAGELIDMAVALARNSLEGSIEIPEAMIRGAVTLYFKGNTSRAKELLKTAMPLYTLERPDKIHRHAVTAWLLGSMEYVTDQRLEGFSHWKVARELFEELRSQAAKEHQREKSEWYRDRLQDMSVYAIQTFEEIYFNWMNQFEIVVLPESLKDLRAILDKQLGAKQIDALRKTLGQYLEESKKMPGLEPGWFALVDAAFYEYENKDYLTALNLLKDAWVGFQLGHYGAVVLWLTGLIQWWFPSKVTNAVENWETSIRTFQFLSKDADQHNQIERHVWYDAQVEWMTTSLRDWIQLTKAG